jgi:hypothetical protein
VVGTAGTSAVPQHAAELCGERFALATARDDRVFAKEMSLGILASFFLRYLVVVFFLNFI